ncbi:MAG: transposase, partial [bacterium]|nr:transposase [bacterium]
MGLTRAKWIPTFDEWFPSEIACIEYVERVRWADGFRCPKCGGESA